MKGKQDETMTRHGKTSSETRRVQVVGCLMSQQRGSVSLSSVSVSVQDGIVALGKAHTRSALSQQSLQGCPRNSANICLVEHRSFSTLEGGMSDEFTCCHTEIQVADQTFYLSQSQYTDIGPTNPSTDPVTAGTWQGSHWSANFKVTGMTRPEKIPTEKAGIEPQVSR